MNFEALKDQARTSKSSKLEIGVILEMLTNPKDKERLQNAIKEMSNSMTRIDAEKDFQKDVVDTMNDELGLEKKYIKKLAAMYHKQNYATVQQEYDELQELYEAITSSPE